MANKSDIVSLWNLWNPVLPRSIPQFLEKLESWLEWLNTPLPCLLVQNTSSGLPSMVIGCVMDEATAGEVHGYYMYLLTHPIYQLNMSCHRLGVCQHNLKGWQHSPRICVPMVNKKQKNSQRTKSDSGWRDCIYLVHSRNIIEHSSTTTPHYLLQKIKMTLCMYKNRLLCWLHWSMTTWKANWV